VVSTPKYALAASLTLLEERGFATDISKYNGVSNTNYLPLSEWTTIKARETDATIFGFINTGL